MADLTGASPDLNNDLTIRASIRGWLTYKVIPGRRLWRLSESNGRRPPLEIGCSNANKPCLIESASVSDPPLLRSFLAPMRLLRAWCR